MYTPSDRMLRLAQTLKDEVDRHLASNHRLVDFAKRFGIGKTALCCAFKNLTSKSLLHYLEQARAEAAIVIMRRFPELSLQEIARRVGYHSERRLRYAFHVAFGESPYTFLKKIRRQV